MEIINRVVYVEKPGVETKIVAMGCVHHGAAGADEALADFWYQKVLRTPNYYIILGGDLVDAIHERDKRYSQEEVAPWCFSRKYGNTLIDRQYNYALEKWKPLAKAGKILWMHSGNHELKLKQRDGRDLTYEWARVLGVPYAGYAALSNLVLRWGQPVARNRKQNLREYMMGARVTFYTTHGSGGAQTAGSVINSASRMLDRFDVDVALMWHLHKRQTIARRLQGVTEPRLIDGRLRSRFRYRDRIAAVCGTFLNGHCEGVMGYGEFKGYEPIVPGPTVIHIKVEMGGEKGGESSQVADVDRRARQVRIWASDAAVKPLHEES